ncbi:MAG: glyoxalase [Chloroflexi bacterium]|nr:glyoxalase [Chloroflexota bacterium]
MISIRPNFHVGDLARAVAFYRRTLGFEVRTEAPEYGLAILGSENVELALLEGTSGSPASAYLEVTDVDAAFEACRADAEAEITAPLTTEPWGLRDFGMRDPWGNALGVGQRVAR